MKKFFTLFFALLCATTIFAQTPAQEMSSVFTGSAHVKGGPINVTVNDVTITYNVNEEDNTKTDMTMSDVAATVKIFSSTFTVTMKATTVPGFTVTKNGNSYSIDDHSFTVTIDNGSGTADVTANVTSSDISIVDQKATMAIHVVDLPSLMTKLGIKSMDITYDLTLDHVIPTEVPGDVNADGVVDIADVNAVLTVMFDSTEYVAAADVNKDGIVDIADVNAVLTIMFATE